MIPEQEQLRKRITGTGDPGVAVTTLQFLVTYGVEPKLINAAITKAVQLEQMLMQNNEDESFYDALNAIIEGRVLARRNLEKAERNEPQ